ncbi:MAG: SH3 domain-containing protein [Thermoanaerobaculia bacterium]
MKRVLVLLLLLAGCAAPPAPPPVASPTPKPQRELGPGRVTATALNVREEATTDAAALTMVRRGDTLQIVEEKEGWYRVRLASGQTGWVSAQYVSLGTAASAPAGRRRSGCPPDSDYAFEKAPLPSFSENGGHGLVVVEASVTAQGSVTSAKVVSNTTGDAALAAIAEREIRSARFIAPVQNCVKRTFIFTYKRAF